MTGISFIGQLGEGKTTACEFLCRQFGAVKVSWADALKIEVYDALYERDPIAASRMTHPDTGGFTTWIEPDGSWPNEKDAPLSDKIAWINARKKQLRPLLQWWGTEYRRHQDDAYWIKRGLERIKEHINHGEFLIVNDDTRFQNEFDALTNSGFVTVRLDADNIGERIQTRDGFFNPDSLKHGSEVEVPTLKSLCQYQIWNTTTIANFYDRLGDLMRDLKVLNYTW